MLNQKNMQNFYNIIDEFFGIELKWNEKLALSNYIEKFNEQEEWFIDGLILFLQDYFGLDWHGLDRKDIYTMVNGKPGWKKYGLGLIGKEEFKEYCRNHVDQWRQERELI